MNKITGTGIYWFTITFLVGSATLFIAGTSHMMHFANADIWQHLAALNALIENPLAPTNPFVESNEPSRLFGPYWVSIGAICHILGLNAVQGFILGSAINLILLSIGIWLLGNALHKNANGAIALLAAMLGGWIFSPNFTGYHSPLTLLSSAGYPAITAVACMLILWGLSIQKVRGESMGVLIPPIVAFSFATHPLGTVVGVTGIGAIATLTKDVPTNRRIALVAFAGLGLGLSAAWPYFNPFYVVATAASPRWVVGINFYSPLWIFSSLFPALIGILGLIDRERRPFLVLGLLCTLGFFIGGTGYFVAGHRLLSFIALILHIGLAGVLLKLFYMNSRSAAVGQVLAICAVIFQTFWTYGQLNRMQIENAHDGNLLDAANHLTRKATGGFAGLQSASFPIAATGKRVLSTPFAEPLVKDMPERQAASEALFDPTLSALQRRAMARDLGVRYLVADVRYAPPNLLAELSSTAVSTKRSGALERFELYRN